jgi:hypothetical protein
MPPERTDQALFHVVIDTGANVVIDSGAARASPAIPCAVDPPHRGADPAAGDRWSVG